MAPLGGGHASYLAGYGQPARFMKNAEGVLRLNTTRLLELCRVDLRGLYFASTTEIYAGAEGLVNETSGTCTHPQHPRGAYIEGKRAGEAILHHACKARAVAFRIALATSPVFQSDDTRVLADLIKGGLRGKVVLNGGGNLERQYQYGPFAAVKMIIAAALGKHPVYNIAGHHVLTLGELSARLARFLGCEVEINDNLSDKSSPKQVLIDTGRFRTELGFDESAIGLEEILPFHLGRERLLAEPR